MFEIKLDLGKNIVETARNSGIPKFQAGNTAGLIDYSINQIPADIPARFTRPGYEISVAPLFAFTMNADEEDANNLAVTSVTLQIENDHLKSHVNGRAFVEKILTQFSSGRWNRYIADACPSVSGRSSLLNKAGQLDSDMCAIDPNYKMTPDEWLHMMRKTQSYEWVGDGVLAKMTVNYDNDVRGITYNIFLDFQDLATKIKHDNANKARELKEGDAKGWDSTKKEAEDLKTIELDKKILEANAIKRGDQVLQR